MNGPSVILALPPENEIRAPAEGGWRPSSESSTPAFFSVSLYFIIASTALGSGVIPGAAFSYPLGIISIMNLIVVSPLGSKFTRERYFFAQFNVESHHFFACSRGSTWTIHDTPKRSATIPKRGEKKVLTSGCCTWPPLPSTENTRSASASVGTVNESEKP